MGTTTRFHLLIAFLVVLAVSFAGSTALADEHDIYANEVADNTELTSDDLSDRQLESFLHAAGQVQDIRASYAEMMEDAADTEERERLREGAAADMETAIEFSGIDVETYRAIGYLYANDDVRQRVDAIAAQM